MRYLYNITKSVLAACLSLLCNSCKAYAIPIKTYDDPTLMKKEVLQRIPVGTSFTSAKKIMEQSGFNCEYEENVMLSSRQPRYGDILYCDKATGFLLVGKQWKVVFDCKEELITNITVSVGGVYP